MTRNAHPSSFGRLILRSLVDSPATPAKSAEPPRPAADPGFVTPLTAAATHKMHPRQAAPSPLGTSPIVAAPTRPDAPRQPGTVPHVVHTGDAERAVKPPRMPAGRKASESRGKR